MSDEDDALIEGLRRSLFHVDSVPDVAVEAARLVPSIASLDAELAELTELAAATRSADESEQLTFQAEDLSVTVLFATERLSVDVIGVPDLGSLQVSLLFADSDERELRFDGDLFRVASDLGGGSLVARIRVRTVGGRVVVTDWFTAEA